MLPILPSLSIGSATLTPHGLFFALGALVGAGFIIAQRDSLNLGVGTILERVFWIFGLSLFGARFAFLLAYPDEWERVSQLVTIWEGGLVSFGGIVVGVIVSMWYYGKAPRGEAWLSAAARAFLLAWAVGRVGNFLSLDSAGLVSSRWNFLYGTVPIELFEALGCLILFFMVRKLKPVDLRYATLLGYFMVRFLVDFWRDEAVNAGLRTSQWVSLAVLLLLGVTYALVQLKKRKQRI
jgi:prolipoprotein diacylglyceryltransferase